MTDDWEQFSASPHQQKPGMSPVMQATSPFLIFDWPDSLHVLNARLLGGKKAVWIDLCAAEQMGMSGQDIQNTLEAKGITIHAKAFYPLDGTVAAVIAVNPEDEARTREILDKMGVLLQ